MSILIKGLRMPRGCDECYIRERDTCPLLKVNVGEWGRYVGCPLVELPDHGDLIDRYMLIGGFADWYIQESPMYLGDNSVVAETIGDAMKAIEDAPVVIPAERSEE